MVLLYFLFVFICKRPVRVRLLPVQCVCSFLCPCASERTSGIFAVQPCSCMSCWMFQCESDRLAYTVQGARVVTLVGKSWDLHVDREFAFC